MLSLGHFLLLDLVVIEFFMHSQFYLLGDVFFTLKVFLHEILLIITATSNKLVLVAGNIPGKVPNTLQLNC